MANQDERFTSGEMADLMDRVQQLLEAKVLAMVIRAPNGRVAITCPPALREEVVDFLKAYDWALL